MVVPEIGVPPWGPIHKGILLFRVYFWVTHFRKPPLKSGRSGSLGACLDAVVVCGLSLCPRQGAQSGPQGFTRRKTRGEV